MTKFRVTAIVTVAILVAPAASWAAATARPSRPGSRSIAVDALMRTFVIRAPSSSDGRTPAPVVFALHPFGMNAQYMASRAPIGANWREAIVIYPNGTPRAGTGPGFAWQGRSGELGDRDLKFFDAMLTWLSTNACVDEKRVFVLGYSNGAGSRTCLRANVPTARRESRSSQVVWGARRHTPSRPSSPMAWLTRPSDTTRQSRPPRLGREEHVSGSSTPHARRLRQSPTGAHRR
jgi:poly(3-hydroxybutyrate) depolymerase